MHKSLLLCAVFFALATTAAQAGWQEDASPYDAGRLSKLDEAKAKGLQEAQAGADFATINAVLSAPAEAVSADQLAGSWRCRTMKLGGAMPDIVYSWFRCRIADQGGTLSFQKVTGSQRLNGTLYPHESGGFVLLGALSTRGEPAHRYSGNHETAGAEATPDDVIGLLSATGPGAARIEIPYPGPESTFDVIELRR